MEEDEGPGRAEPLQGPPHPSMLIAREERDLLVLSFSLFFFIFPVIFLIRRKALIARGEILKTS